MAVARPGQWIREKKSVPNLGLGLNFATKVDFWFFNYDFNKKTEGKTCDFWSCSILSKTVIFVLLIFQTMIFSRNRWLYWVHWVPQFGELSSQYTKLIVKPMFTPLWKLRFFLSWGILKCHMAHLGHKGLILVPVFYILIWYSTNAAYYTQTNLEVSLE